MQTNPSPVLRRGPIAAAAAAFLVALWGTPLILLLGAGEGLEALMPGGASLLVLGPAAMATVALGAGLGLWARRRGARGPAGLLHDRQSAAGRLMAGLLDGIAPGAALVDPEGRLVAWNAGFPSLAELPHAALRGGRPFAEVLRHRAPGDAPPGQAVRIRRRADGSRVEERWARYADGSALMTCRLVAQPPPPGSPPGFEAERTDAIRLRLPSLAAAAAGARLIEAGLAARAMRDAAEDFGLHALAAVLAEAEGAAARGDLAGLRAAVARLPALAESAPDGAVASAPDQGRD